MNCRHCGRAYEVRRLDLLGQTYRMPVVMCECSDEYEDAQMVARLTSAANLPRSAPSMTFDTWQARRGSEEAYATARGYCDELDEAVARGVNLIIGGPVGNGKTHLLCAVAQWALTSGYPLYWINAADLTNALRFDNSDRAWMIDNLKRVQILALDDLGRESSAEWMMDELFAIVNTRYEDKKPIIATTNVSADKLMERIGQATYGRLTQFARMVKNRATDYRLEGS